MNNPNPQASDLWLRALERAETIRDLQRVLLRARAAHSRLDLNQHLFDKIEPLVQALAEDAELRIAIAYRAAAVTP